MRARTTCALVLVTAAAAGCGGGGPSPLDVKGPHLQPLAERCATHVEARVGWFRAADGVRLDGAVLGTGKTGVVLAHESPADLCGWVPYARMLTGAGFRVLLFDHRGFGSSESPADSVKAGHYSSDLVGAVDELKREGADSVFLMGASFGGVTSMVAGSRLGTKVAGVISVSGETRLGPGDLDALAAVPKLRAPFLILASQQDGFLLPDDARQLERRAGSEHKRLVVFPGGNHGWDLFLSSPQKARASRTVIDFLRKYS
jgi:alpha-beta hydrolase superfamily lysophospholipase